MPISGGTYRTMTTKTGKKVRLHFSESGEVDEAKNLASGATHTPAEFKADKKKRAKKAKKRSLPWSGQK
jgi:hypothetical protein